MCRISSKHRSRVASALAEALTPAAFTMTTFPNDGGYDQMVLVRDIGFSSLCAHHMLPFIGVAHVAYIPGERVVGLSKLARLVEHAARRLQTQERLTNEVAETLPGHARSPRSRRRPRGDPSVHDRPRCPRRGGADVDERAAWIAS